MKKFILLFITSLLFATNANSQGCAPNCTLYTTTTITPVFSPTVGTFVSLSDDQVSAGCPIGFTFTFFCNAYNTFYISSNGFISFNPAVSNGCCSGQAIPSPGNAVNNMIAFDWNDIYPPGVPGGGGITYYTTGIAPNRICIISYTSIPHCCNFGPAFNSGQIKLYESTNTIDVLNGVVTTDGSTATQGIMNQAGTIAYPVAGRNGVTWTGTNEATRFTVSGVNPTAPPSISGPVTLCGGGGPYTYSVAPLGGALSYNWTLPVGWTGSSVTNTIGATPGATGILSVSVTYTCGTSSITTLAVTVNPAPTVPSPVTASPSTFCAVGGTLNLNAVSAGNSITWYTVPVGGTPIGTSLSGANFSTTAVTTTTYYAESSSVGQVTLNYTGSMQSHTVPNSISVMTVDIRGAQGGSAYPNPPTGSYGGNGGRVTGTLAVTPGQVLNVYVAGVGGNGGLGISGAAGYNGGGLGANYPGNYGGGGGGGASDIRVAPYGLANRIAVAGGGGGGAYNYGCATCDRGGMGGGLTGEGGYSNNLMLGQGAGAGGTQIAGGAAGNWPGWCAGSAGVFGIGGAGGICTNDGGGGGGGYYGGGGGAWSGGGGGSSFLLNGTHTQGFQSGNGQVILTGGGCTSPSRGMVVVTVNPNPTITITGTTQICIGGTTTLTAGGAATYSWSNGALTPSIVVSPTINTTYSVIGTTAGGCTASAVQVVTVNALPIITITGPNTVCIGSPALLTANGGNTYTWSTGANTNTIAPTPTVNISYSVTGSNTLTACSNTAIQNITVSPLPTVSIAGNSVICANQSMTLTGSGANTYSWSTGAIGNPIAVTPTVTTTYSVIGTSVVGCTSTAVKTVSVNPGVTVTITGTNQICIGGTLNLTANGANTYSWSNGALTQTIAVTPTANIVYTVTGTNTLTGCSASTVQSVTVNPLPVVTITGNSVICLGNTLSLTANGANTYTWSTGALTNTIATTPTANIVYTVSGTNAVTGCSNSATQPVTVTALPSVSITGATSICVGQSATLTASGAATYSWNTGALTNTVSVSPVVTTTYSVIGTAAGGCTSSAVYTLNVNLNPTVTITGTNQICIGGAVNYTANGATTYSWNTGALTQTITANPIVNTVYSVIGTNAVTGCTASALVNATVNPLPVVTITGSSVICLGNTLNLTGNGANTYTWSTGANTNTIATTPTANVVYTVSGTNAVTGCSNSAVQSVTVNSIPTVAISGPTAICVGQSANLIANGANTYSWNTGALTNTISVSPIVNTTYSVIGTSAGGCSASALYTLIVNQNPTVSITGNTAVCIGSTVNLTGNGATTYTWSTGALTNTIGVSPLFNATYTIVGVNAVTGCTNSASFPLTVNNLPTLSIAGNNTICAGLPLSLTASGANTYTWSTGANTSTIVDTPTISLTYSVNGTSALTGCSNLAVFSVTVGAVPSVTIMGPYAMCITQTVNYTAYGAPNYTWSTGSTSSVIAISPTVNTSYTVWATSPLGCGGGATVKSITVNPIPTVFANATSTLICKGESVQLTASGVDTYSWNTGALTAIINVTPMVNTTYTVTGTNTTTGCYNDTTITVMVSLCTGIKQQAGNQNLELNVYPNPNNGEFTVELSNGLNKTIEVYDLVGRTILTQSSEDDKIYLNITDLSNGIYYVKVQSDNSVTVVKIIKQ